MTAFVLAMALFIAIHLGVSGTRLRGAAVASLGENVYRGLFSVASALCLAGVIWFFDPDNAANPVWWDASAGRRWLAVLILLPAWVLLVGALSQSNPTAVGQEAGLARGAEAATGVLRVTRHPFLIAVLLWAFADLLNKGDLVSGLLFGGFGLVAAWGTLAIDAKALAAKGDAYRRFMAATSVVPFLAIVQGRNRLVLGEIGWWRLALGLVLWAALLQFHGAVFGVPAVLL